MELQQCRIMIKILLTGEVIWNHLEMDKKYSIDKDSNIQVIGYLLNKSSKNGLILSKFEQKSRNKWTRKWLPSKLKLNRMKKCWMPLLFQLRIVGKSKNLIAEICSQLKHLKYLTKLQNKLKMSRGNIKSVVQQRNY